MLHIVTLWMHADTWGMLGFKASFFGTQISSKSKTLKTATEKKPCHTENGNKIKEAKRCLGVLLPAVLQILRNHRIMREIGPQKETCQLLDIKTKVDILHPEELRASPQCSTACACWKPCAQSGSTVGRSLADLSQSSKPSNLYKDQSSKMPCSLEMVNRNHPGEITNLRHLWTPTSLHLVKWVDGWFTPPSIKALSGILHTFEPHLPPKTNSSAFRWGSTQYTPKTGWKAELKLEWYTNPKRQRWNE